MSEERDFVEILQPVGQRILEDWAMMLVDPATPEQEESLLDGEEVYRSSVNFSGEKAGQISILSNGEFLRALGSNLVGEDAADLDENVSVDGFKELANVIAGNFLTEAFGDGRVFDLSSPIYLKLSSDEVSRDAKSGVSICLVADDAPVVIRVIFE